MNRSTLFPALTALVTLAAAGAARAMPNECTSTDFGLSTFCCADPNSHLVEDVSGFAYHCDCDGGFNAIQDPSEPTGVGYCSIDWGEPPAGKPPIQHTPPTPPTPMPPQFTQCKRCQLLAAHEQAQNDARLTACKTTEHAAAANACAGGTWPDGSHSAPLPPQNCTQPPPTCHWNKVTRERDCETPDPVCTDNPDYDACLGGMIYGAPGGAIIPGATSPIAPLAVTTSDNITTTVYYNPQRGTDGMCADELALRSDARSREIAVCKEAATQADGVSCSF